MIADDRSHIFSLSLHKNYTSLKSVSATLMNVIFGISRRSF